MILISVVVPIYNVERYIERCARSLFEQTMKEGIEFIFVDDCSPDKSIERLEKILEDYSYRKSQTKIIHHSENRGLPTARRSGIAAAKGEYIVHCDSDDWMEPNAYQMLVEEVTSKNLDMVIFNMWSQLDEKLKPMKLINGISTIDANNAMDLLLSKKMTEMICNKLVRRNIYEQMDLIHEAGMGEGFVFSVQCCYYSQKISYIDAPLYHYCYNGESICHNPTEESFIKRSKDYMKNIDIVIEFLKQKNLYEKYKLQMASFKFRCRMVSYIGNPNPDYSFWHSIYPELDTWKYISRMSGKDLLKYSMARLHFKKGLFYLREVYHKLISANYLSTRKQKNTIGDNPVGQ